MKSKLLFLLLILVTTIFSCETEKERKDEQINIKSKEIITNAISEFTTIGNGINTDSLLKCYKKISKDSAQLGLEYAEKLSEEATKLIVRQKFVSDSISKAELDSTNKADAIAKRKWDNSAAGRIQKKHPDWSDDDCDRVARHKVWVGMTLGMLKYERGNPNSANPSNYGSGTEWQWCWEDYTPSCFYGGDDLIITSYN